MGSNPTNEALFSFSMEKEMFRLVVLPCFDLCRSKSFHVQEQSHAQSTAQGNEKNKEIDRREK